MAKTLGFLFSSLYLYRFTDKQRSRELRAAPKSILPGMQKKDVLAKLGVPDEVAPHFHKKGDKKTIDGIVWIYFLWQHGDYDWDWNYEVGGCSDEKKLLLF